MENHGAATKNIARQPGSRPRKKTSAGGTKPGPPARTERKWKCSEAPFMGLRGRCRLPSCICNSRRLSICLAAPMGATSCGQHVGLRARVVVLEGHERAHQSKLGFEQQNRFRNLREIQRIEKKALRARADAAQSARQGGTEPRDHPLQRRTQDHRATSPAEGPRRAHGSAAAKRARPRRRANIARGKICDFGPELGFEQRNRFRSLRDTRRTEKKVLRKPPAGGPVVGQTFKYIY